MAGGIFVFIIIASSIYGVFSGNAEAVAQGFLSGAADAVTFVFSMAGVYMLWTGVMSLASDSGLASAMAKVLSYPLSFLFKGIKRESSAMEKVCLNITANVLGMGNAATPFGIKAMEELQKHNRTPESCSDDMAMLIVINSSSVQLIPASIIALRMSAGSASPGDITADIIVATTVTTAVGIAACKLFERIWR